MKDEEEEEEAAALEAIKEDSEGEQSFRKAAFAEPVNPHFLWGGGKWSDKDQGQRL